MFGRRGDARLLLSYPIDTFVGMLLFSLLLVDSMHLFRGCLMLSDRHEVIFDAFDASTQASTLPGTLTLKLRLVFFLIRVLDKTFLSPFGHLDAPACRSAVGCWRGEVLGDG